MSGRYGHDHSGRELADALNAGGMRSMVYGGELTGSYAEWVIVAEASDQTNLIIQTQSGWLSFEGYAESDDYGGEVLTALNAGNCPAIYYAGADPDSVYGNILLTERGITVSVTTGWPT